MQEILFDILKAVVGICALIVARYCIPWIRQRISQEKLREVREWARMGVLYAQQVLSGESGQTRKEIVRDMLLRLCHENEVSLTAEQIEVLIESAVKQMKMEQG